jgi:hypothetical protein
MLGIWQGAAEMYLCLLSARNHRGKNSFLLLPLPIVGGVPILIRTVFT